MTATLSIQGLHQWSSKVFEHLKVPDGVDRDVAIQSILMECFDLELLYPDWESMHSGIGVWSARRLPIWEKLYASTNFDYNPIENYDRQEDWIDESDRGGTTGSTRKTETDQASDSNTNGRDNSTTINRVQGYDGSEWENHDQSAIGTETSARRIDTQFQQVRDDYGEVRKEIDHNRRSGRAHGNVGVTTTQQMISQERDIVDYDIYSVIVNDFVDAFCIGVY